MAIKQYTRTSSRMDGALLSRSPFTTIARYEAALGTVMYVVVPSERLHLFDAVTGASVLAPNKS